jgi:hypothetical protein
MSWSIGVGGACLSHGSDVLHAIDARVVHDAMHYLALHDNRAGRRAWPRLAWWGLVRSCVAQFLANPWQGTRIVVYGPNGGAIIPSAGDPILTMEPPGTAEQTAIPSGHA